MMRWKTRRWGEGNFTFLGVQWGDEGKGIVVVRWVEQVGAKLGVRSGGGANAGHSIHDGDRKVVFHLLPSCIALGIPGAIGRGVFVNPHLLNQEADEYGRNRIPDLWVDEGAPLSFIWHQLLEGQIEDTLAKGKRAVGSTRRGISPTAAMKMLRLNPRVGQLFRPDRLRQSLDDLYAVIGPLLGSTAPTPDVVADELLREAAGLKAYVCDVRERLVEQIKLGEPVVFEGAQGGMLDLDWGTYPYVTAGKCTVAGMVCDLGLPVQAFGTVVGVLKAYTTRVGEGPFPTELVTAPASPLLINREAQLAELLEKINSGEATDSEIGQYLCWRGGEFGATTGRQRRTGWLDLAQALYQDAINGGFDQIAVTKLDCLSGLDRILVATAYELDGVRLPSGTMPADASDVARLRPVYTELPGWREDIRTVTERSKLPTNALRYLAFIEDALQSPVTMIGTGPDRANVIWSR